MIKTKNKYTYPVKISGKVKISYKDSPAHIGRLENGVDFIVPEGTEIKAAAAGIVVDVKQDSSIGGKEESFDSLGNYIEIKHSNNEYSIYEHIKTKGSFVAKGDRVKEGQTIGLSGATGWIAHLGPHLHFDVHIYFGEGEEDYETLKIEWKK